VAIAYTSTLPDGGTLSHAAFGIGGTGGDNLTGTMADDGVDGKDCKTLNFDDESCTR
jgi:hypothetical protein